MDTSSSRFTKAEQNASKCLSFSFCKALKLDNIKETLEKMLNHIGDNGMFAEYTMHDISHVNGMLNLLDIIIPENTKKEMTSADWLMIVLAVYFHDLGMHIPSGEYENRNNDSEFVATKAKMLSNNEVKEYVDSLEGDKGEKFLYQEYVRRNHGKRIYQWISNCDKKAEEPYKMIGEMLAGLDSNFRSDLALVCQSHQMDELPDHLKSVDEAYGSSKEEKVNLLYVCVLLRSADILHMTHDRTPDVEFRIISPKNKISVVEWAKQKAVRSIDVHYEKNEAGNVDKTIQPHSFEVQAKFTDDNSYFSFKSFLVYAIDELKRCHNWCEESRQINSNNYCFPWTDIDTSRVNAEGFSKNKLRFEIDQQNILKLLTGHTLYNDSTVVLRELIQNAMDAGRLQDSRSKIGSKYQSRVEVSWDSKTRLLRVSDNATGMDVESITGYLLKVGASKYQSEAFKKDYPDFHSISRFGIGLLTCFMISDDVDVYTLDEEEKQCHLLKIRNLNGEYLMRNDADVSNILEGAHGTTFELKVRADIKMDNIEQQIRQWIVIPFGELTLSIDGGPKQKIGYKTVKDAVEDFALRLNGAGLSTGNYRVLQQSKSGMDVAVLQRYDPIMKVWYLYQYYESDYLPEAPIGICVEGIRVTSESPGMRGRNYVVIANCIGKNSPTTNVARNELEGGRALEQMYHAIYETYIDSFVSQIQSLQDNYSLTWAATEINFLINNFYNSRLFVQFDKREVLNSVLKKAKCIPVDDGSKIDLFSVDSLPEKICTLDSRAFTAAVSLLKDMKSVNRTAYSLLSELEHNEIKDEAILLVDAMASCINEIFLNSYEVISIDAEESVRKIKYIWSTKKDRWKHINVSRRRSRGHLFVLMNDDGVRINGMEKKAAITTGLCVYLIGESPLKTFMKHVIEELKINEDELDIISDLVCMLLIHRMPSDDQSIDSYLNSEDNYLKKSLFSKFSISEFKAALKDCYDMVIDIDKYYRFFD